MARSYRTDRSPPGWSGLVLSVRLVLLAGLLGIISTFVPGAHARETTVSDPVVRSGSSPEISPEGRTLVSEALHLRTTEEQEWTDFPVRPDARSLAVTFSGSRRIDTLALALRQTGVKQGWTVALNGESLGELVRNEQPLNVLLAVPPELLREGANRLTVRQEGDAPDDVRVGPVRLLDASPSELLDGGRLSIAVRDRTSGARLPSRITVVDSTGALQPVRPVAGEDDAVRTGVVYAIRGRTTIELPAGTYTVYAGRGPEYSVDSAVVESDTEEGTVDLEIERVVDTEGWVASDPHIHTFTHSGHGDATVHERLATLVGEAVELPIATDHNVHVDYRAAAAELGLLDAFTPVIGNEVTTPVGHFNVYPVESGADPPAHEFTTWEPIFEAIESTPGVRMVILDHGRDVHDGYRPFGPAHFNPVTGRQRDGWPAGYDALEVVNSSAQQVDVMRLVRDWFAQLNRGRRLTPIGSSDSHDVNRYLVGQGRTYVRTADSDPGGIDVAEAVRRTLGGRVTVSEGLFAEIEVEGREAAGRRVAVEGPVTVRARVQGPGWVRAHRVALYANGRKIRELELDEEAAGRSGLKWAGTWTLDPVGHDRHLVVVARGPGVEAPYWPIPRPYQHEENTYEPEVIAVTGAAYVDADGGGFQAARAYAEEAVEQTAGRWRDLLDRLASFDRAVSAQAGEVLRSRHTDAYEALVEAALGADGTEPAAWSEAPAPVRAGLEAFHGTVAGETAPGAPR